MLSAERLLCNFRYVLYENVLLGFGQEKNYVAGDAGRMVKSVAQSGTGSVFGLLHNVPA